MNKTTANSWARFGPRPARRASQAQAGQGDKRAAKASARTLRGHIAATREAFQTELPQLRRLRQVRTPPTRRARSGSAHTNAAQECRTERAEDRAAFARDVRHERQRQQRLRQVRLRRRPRPRSTRPTSRTRRTPTSSRTPRKECCDGARGRRARSLRDEVRHEHEQAQRVRQVRLDRRRRRERERRASRRGARSSAWLRARGSPTPKQRHALEQLVGERLGAVAVSALDGVGRASELSTDSCTTSPAASNRSRMRQRVVAEEAELVALALDSVRDAVSGRERDHVLAARVRGEAAGPAQPERATGGQPAQAGARRAARRCRARS